MTMVVGPHIYNCLAYMASLAKKILLIKCSQLVAINCGTYAKIIYVEKLFLVRFFKSDQKN